jgi:hypothetical protein
MDSSTKAFYCCIGAFFLINAISHMYDVTVKGLVCVYQPQNCPWNVTT